MRLNYSYLHPMHWGTILILFIFLFSFRIFLPKIKTNKNGGREVGGGGSLQHNRPTVKLLNVSCSHAFPSITDFLFFQVCFSVQSLTDPGVSTPLCRLLCCPSSMCSESPDPSVVSLSDLTGRNLLEVWRGAEKRVNSQEFKGGVL